MKKTITIVGAGGQMGQWFTKYFLSNNFEVMGYDEESKIKNKDVKQADSLIVEHSIFFRTKSRY